jgi:hypothetical protein
MKTILLRDGRYRASIGSCRETFQIGRHQGSYKFQVACFSEAGATVGNGMLYVL